MSFTPFAPQVDQSERSDAQKKIETSVATLVKHWSAVMPKGNLTAGALKHLLEQRDNKLFDGIMELCVSPHVAPAFPPGMSTSASIAKLKASDITSGL